MSRSSSRDVNVPLLRTDASASRTRSRPGSRPGSRPRASRHSAHASITSFAHDIEDIINPGALVLDEDAEVIPEFTQPHHHHHAENTLVEEEEDECAELEGDAAEEASDEDWRQKLPWWKRPSPWWFLAYVPFAAIAMSITAAAKVELFTYLACLAHPPGNNGSERTYPDLTGPSASAVPDIKICAQDPVVRVAVANLTMVILTTMGVLTCLTTAWWASLSDRYGRTRILGFAVVGILAMDLNILSVFWFYDYVPGGYYFLILGPLVEGLLGGQALLSGTIHAYISDCTPPALRSGMFSLHLGLVFTGVGIGPTLGGLVIRFTGQFINVFYISAMLHLIYALLVWFVIPESLSRADMLEARARHKVADDETRAAYAQGGFKVFLQRMFAFITPLRVFLPVDIHGGNPAKGKRKDWSLLFLVVAYGFMVSLVALYLYTIQFLTGVYGWNTEQVGYWFSSVGAARAIFLTVILPFLIRLAKRWSRPIQLPLSPNEPLTSPRSPSPHPNRPHSPQFDLSLARISLAVDALVYIFVIFSTSGLMFAVATAGSALGMGFGPATHAVALTLYNRRGGKDSGRLFGAMSVVQALSSQVFGPFVYGMTYARTATTMPKAIFVMAGGAVVVSCVLMLLVRIPEDAPTAGMGTDVEEQPALAREETLVDDVSAPLIVVDDEDEEGDRGRKVGKP